MQMWFLFHVRSYVPCCNDITYDRTIAIGLKSFDERTLKNYPTSIPLTTKFIGKLLHKQPEIRDIDSDIAKLQLICTSYYLQHVHVRVHINK